MTDPNNTNPAPRPGITGWLSLAALGMFIAPLLYLFNLVVLYLVYDRQWYQASGATARRLLGTQALAEVLFLGAAVACAIAFFNKRKSAPKNYAAYLLARAFYGLANLAIAPKLVQPTNDFLPAFWLYLAIVAAVWAALWAPTLLLSRRVKNTFTDSDEKNRQERWLSFGYNVHIQVIAVLGVVILLNVIGYRQRGHYRKDITASRQYTLSDQTRGVIGRLKHDYQIVTLMTPAGQYLREQDAQLTAQRIQSTRDVVDEYGHLSKRITTEHIDPTTDTRRVQEFLATLRARFEEKLDPIDRAVKAGQDALAKVRSDLGRATPALRAAADDPAISDPRLRESLDNIAQAFAAVEPQLKSYDAPLRRALDQPLPDYRGARDLLVTLLTEPEDRLFAPATAAFTQAVATPEFPASVKERLLAFNQQLDQLRQTMKSAVDELRSAQSNEEYDRLNEQLAQADPVVIVGPSQVQVVRLAQMFRELASQGGEESKRDVRFLGEELLTGALISMSLEQKPMVVFVSTSPRPALQGFMGVGQRLRNSNFEVEQWNPAGMMGPMGNPMPPRPAPQPAPGQKAVWVLLADSGGEDPMAIMAARAKQMAIEHIGKRLESGDGALVLTGPSPASMYGSGDPVADFVATWGITAQTDRIIVFERTARGRRQVDSQLPISQWPSEHRITSAMGQMPGIFLFSAPLQVSPTKDAATRVHPLVRFEHEDMWAETNIAGHQTAKLNIQTAARVFTLGVAVERDAVGQGAGNTPGRLVVVANPYFPADALTTVGLDGNPGTAELIGALFPANAELFVNSVYWLAGMDDLIAAGARTQDVRRIGKIDPTRLLALRWSLLAGMPALTLLVGAGVWWVRRRG